MDKIPCENWTGLHLRSLKSDRQETRVTFTLEVRQWANGGGNYICNGLGNSLLKWVQLHFLLCECHSKLEDSQKRWMLI